MGYDKRPGGFGGGSRGGFKGGSGRPSFGGHSGEKKEMFTAVCATCQKQCEVPFRPTGERPVYCRDCFRNAREDSGTDFTRGHDRPMAPHAAPKRDFAPSYAAKPAPQSAPVTDRRIDDLKRQVENLTAKIDMVLAILKPTAAPVAASAVSPVAAPAASVKKAAAKKKSAAKKK